MELVARMRCFDPDDLVATLRPWLLQHLCPFWLARIVYPAGGFFENLDAAGQPLPERRRTTLVQARLTYVFSHAFVLSGEESFRQAAEHGFSFLTRICRSPEAGEGWLRAVALDGDALDDTFDFYDQAFVLFALAWYARATNSGEAIVLAHAAYRFLEERLAHPHGGFREEYSHAGGAMKLPRRQNPHMHLLETALALHAATGDRVWLGRAAALVDLFRSRFVDPNTGALIEFFADDWSPAPGAQGQWREPGHQFEWVWLLFDFARHSGDRSVIADAERLFTFGSQFGIEREGLLSGAVLDGVDADGTLVAATKLLWPQTEYIKACVARAEQLGDAQARPSIRAHLKLIAQSFLRPDGASWHNQLARDGTPVDAPTPARVLYHLFLAAAEVERLIALRAAPPAGGRS